MKRKPSEASVVLKKNTLKIYIGGLLHLSLKAHSIVGVQSYHVGTEFLDIDFTLIGGNVTCRYVRRDLWEEILRGLDKLDLFPVQ